MPIEMKESLISIVGKTLPEIKAIINELLNEDSLIAEMHISAEQIRIIHVLTTTFNPSFRRICIGREN